MCKKGLCVFLLLNIFLTGCFDSGLETSNPPSSDSSTDSSSSAVTSSTPVWEPEIPVQRTLRSSSDTAYIVRMDQSWLIAEETDGVSSYSVVYPENPEPELFFSADGRNLGFHKIDDATFVLSWYTSDEGIHYRLYALEDLQTPMESPLGSEIIRYQFLDHVLYYTAEQSENDSEDALPYAVYRLVPGEQPEKLLENSGWDFCLAGDTIYYTKNSSLYAMDLTGTHHVKVYDLPWQEESDAFRFTVMDHWVLFSCEGEYSLGYVYNLRSQELVPLNCPVYAEDFVSDEEYYYLSGPEGVYRVNAETMELEVLADLAAGGLSIYEGNLYFHSLRDGNGSSSDPTERVYRIDTESKEMTVVY